MSTYKTHEAICAYNRSQESKQIQAASRLRELEVTKAGGCCLNCRNHKEHTIKNAPTVYCCLKNKAVTKGAYCSQWKPKEPRK